MNGVDLALQLLDPGVQLLLGHEQGGGGATDEVAAVPRRLHAGQGLLQLLQLVDVAGGRCCGIAQLLGECGELPGRRDRPAGQGGHPRRQVVQRLHSSRVGQQLAQLGYGVDEA
ncbi:hypothetical protein D9M70_618170 [compost metagenome]